MLKCRKSSWKRLHLSKKDEKAAVYNDEDKKRTIRLAVGAVVYAIGMALTVFAKLPTLAELAFLIVAYVILGWDVVWQAVKNITRGQVFDEHFLMSVSTIGAFAIGGIPGSCCSYAVLSGRRVLPVAGGKAFQKVHL